MILTQRGRGTAVLMNIDGWKALLHQVEELTEDQEDMEDIRAADANEARIARGEERTYSHEEVWAEIDAYHSGQMAGNLPSD